MHSLKTANVIPNVGLRHVHCINCTSLFQVGYHEIEKENDPVCIAEHHLQRRAGCS